MSLPPKKLENALYYDANNNVTIRTDAVGGGGGIASSVSISNFPANQAVVGNVNVTSGSVSISNFPANQAVVGNVNVTSGSVSISNFPATQNVAIASGTNNIGLVKITDNTGTGITSTTLSGKQRLDVNLAAGGVPATTAPNWADQVAGVDKSGNLRVLSVDINGNLNVNASTTSNLSIQTPVDISVTGTLGSLNATVPINIKGVSSLYAVVTGTWSGTINWYGSADGITFVPLIVAAGGPTNVYSTAGITTNAGVRIAIPAGFTIINATMTAYTSGSAQITMNASNGTAVTESIQLNPANFKATVIGNVNVSAGSLSINNFPTTQNVQLADSAIFVSSLPSNFAKSVLISKHKLSIFLCIIFSNNSDCLSTFSSITFSIEYTNFLASSAFLKCTFKISKICKLCDEVILLNLIKYKFIFKIFIGVMLCQQIKYK